MHSLLAAIARFLMYVIALLPLSFARAIGSLLGRLSWWAQDRGAQTTLDNLFFCFPEIGKLERAAIAKQSLRETYKLAGEAFLVWNRDKAWLKSKTLAIHNDHLLREPLAAGQGVLVAVPHLGNWEFLGAHFCDYAKPTCMYQPPKKVWLEELVKEKRQGTGMTLVPTSPRGVAAQLKALKAGEIVAILPDQVPAEESGIFSPFFGMQAYTMTLIHGFIQRTNCKVVMGIAQRVEKGFELHFLAPDDAIYSEDEQTSVNALNTSVENCVRVCRTQYQWEYKRFKKQPDGLPNPYDAKNN